MVHLECAELWLYPYGMTSKDIPNILLILRANNLIIATHTPNKGIVKVLAELSVYGHLCII